MSSHLLRILALLGTSATLAAGAFPKQLLEKEDRWFKSDDARKAIDNIISWQSPEGSWPKNKDATKAPFTGDRNKLTGTFDNRSTTDELRFLARAFEATGDETCQAAFLTGFDHILRAQYLTGGWPQHHPPGKGYYKHITFNDDCMIRLLDFLREASSSKAYRFLDAPRRKAAAAAVDRGIDCILKCQVIMDGEPTVWCAQHDADTLAPATARSYELPSLSGSESAGILRFLMSIERPSPEIIRSVRAGVKWFEDSRIEGIRIESRDGDRIVVEDRSAPGIWARFYDLETNEPFFCGRDGVKKPRLADIEKERRSGYAWYGNWGESVAKTYQNWPRRGGR